MIRRLQAALAFAILVALSTACDATGGFGGKSTPAPGGGDRGEDGGRLDEGRDGGGEGEGASPTKQDGDGKRPLDEGEGVPGYELTDPRLLSLQPSEQGDGLAVALGLPGSVRVTGGDPASVPLCIIEVAAAEAADAGRAPTVLAARTLRGALSPEGALTAPLGAGFDAERIVAVRIATRCPVVGAAFRERAPAQEALARYVAAEIMSPSGPGAMARVAGGALLVLEGGATTLASGATVPLRYARLPADAAVRIAFVESLGFDDNVHDPAAAAPTDGSAGGRATLTAPAAAEDRWYEIRALRRLDTVPFQPLARKRVRIKAAADLTAFACCTDRQLTVTQPFNAQTAQLEMTIADPATADDQFLFKSAQAPAAPTVFPVNLTTGGGDPIWELRVFVTENGETRVLTRRFFRSGI